jgi:hypothetical protein
VSGSSQFAACISGQIASVGTMPPSITTIWWHASSNSGSSMPPTVGNKRSVSASTCSSPHTCAASWPMIFATVVAPPMSSENAVSARFVFQQSIVGATPAKPPSGAGSQLPTITMS